MTSDATLTLIAKVLAWQDGIEPHELDTVARNRLWMDAAQQCAEDLALTLTESVESVTAAAIRARILEYADTLTSKPMQSVALTCAGLATVVAL